MDERLTKPLKVIAAFLAAGIRTDLKNAAIEHVLGLTGSASGRELFLGQSDILKEMIILLRDKTLIIAKSAALALINISADENGASELISISESSKSRENLSSNLIDICLKYIIERDKNLADPCCMILSNLTRPSILVDRIITLVEGNGYTLDSLISVFCKEVDKNFADLHYLGPIFSNLSQSPKVRRCLTDRDRFLLQKLLPFSGFVGNVLRRGGIVGTLKNCCFDIDNHEWFLNSEIDLLSYLLLPLAGPEEFDEENTKKLPIDLQYLPETKQREPDPDIRLMLLQSLTQLCATKRVREFLRDKNTYVILKEFHKWEKDKTVLLACENIVNILIRTEDEIGVDNLKDIEVPDEYTEKFHGIDDFIKG